MKIELENNKMAKKRIAKILVICMLGLVLAFISERTGGELGKDNSISRGAPGDGDRSVDLTVSGEGILEDYIYSVNIEEQQVTDKMAQEWFSQAKKEIDTYIFNGEKPDCVTQSLNLKESYADGMVKAKWSFSDYEHISSEGVINPDDITESGQLITATAELSCEDQKEIYEIPFQIFPPKLSKKEQLIHDIEKNIKSQQQNPGKNISLPQQIDGVKLTWGEINQHLIFKTACFEVVILILLVLLKRERAQQEIKQREDEMKLDYSEVVSKLAILLGSGMTIRQSWNRISARYIEERDKDDKKRRFAYEEMLKTYYEMKDGASEKSAYQEFGESCGISEYHRLSRLLVQNLQKGNRGLSQILQKEAEAAFEERKIIAKKMGEEAGTKLLAPLMIMLIIVIAIVMFPAMLEFGG